MRVVALDISKSLCHCNRGSVCLDWNETVGKVLLFLVCSYQPSSLTSPRLQLHCYVTCIVKVIFSGPAEQVQVWDEQMMTTLCRAILQQLAQRWLIYQLLSTATTQCVKSAPLLEAQSKCHPYRVKPRYQSHGRFCTRQNRAARSSEEPALKGCASESESSSVKRLLCRRCSCSKKRLRILLP